MSHGTPNLLLMISFPLVCLAICALMDLGLMLARRRKLSLFPGGTERLYWAVMVAAMLRSAIFSLFFVPALALESRVLMAYPATQMETAIIMVLPALFGAFFATRLERLVFDRLESALLRDRQRFLGTTDRIGGKVLP